MQRPPRKRCSTKDQKFKTYTVHIYINVNIQLIVTLTFTSCIYTKSLQPLFPPKSRPTLMELSQPNQPHIITDVGFRGGAVLMPVSGQTRLFNPDFLLCQQPAGGGGGGGEICCRIFQIIWWCEVFTDPILAAPVAFWCCMNFRSWLHSPFYVCLFVFKKSASLMR